MTDQTNPSEAAAASSLFTTDRLLMIEAKPFTVSHWDTTAMAREILRLRKDCPPTAEVEQLQAELARLRRAIEAQSCEMIGAAKLLRDADSLSLPAEAQTAIAAMRDVGPELAKAGIQVGPRLSHAEAVAQLRGERDRWREKCDEADKEAGSTARWILAMCDRLAGAGFDWTGAKSNAGRLFGKAEAMRESSLDPIQAAKRKQIIADLAPIVNRHSLESAGGDTPDIILAEAMLDAALAFGKTTRARDVWHGFRPCPGFELATGGVVAAGTIPGASPFPPFHHGGKVGSATETVDALCGNEPSAHKQEFTAFGESLRGCAAPKVGPATGQPRTEVPPGTTLVDGSGTVLDLGEAFRVAMRESGTADHEGQRLRWLRDAVAELAKAVERIGTR